MPSGPDVPGDSVFRAGGGAALAGSGSSVEGIAASIRGSLSIPQHHRFFCRKIFVKYPVS